MLALNDIYENFVQGYEDDVEKYIQKGKLANYARYCGDCFVEYFLLSILRKKNNSNILDTPMKESLF